MEKLDRKTVVLMVAGIIAIVIVTLLLLLPSWFGGGAEEPTPTSSQTPAPVTNTPTPVPTEIVVPEGEGAAGGNIYMNDYSNDLGYDSLPQDAVPTDIPDGTILDPVWANEKMTQLACELSTKDLVEERALEPLEAFAADLPLAGEAWGNNTDDALRANIRSWLESYRATGEGKRVPGDVRAVIEGYCAAGSEPDDSGPDGGDIVEGSEPDAEGAVDEHQH